MSKIRCSKCYRDVTHLIGDDPPIYGGCPWCRSFETHVEETPLERLLAPPPVDVIGSLWDKFMSGLEKP